MFSKNKVIVRMQGGLGNQLFIFAFGKSLAKRLNINVCFDVTKYDVKNPYREFGLGVFNIKDINLTKKGHGKDLFKKILKKILIFKCLKKYIEPKEKVAFEDYKHINQAVDGFFYDESLYEISGRNYIEGFFQNPRYFEDIREEILNDFSLKEPLKGKNKELLNSIKGTDSCSVHVRRGDYIDNSGTYVLTPDYYKQAMDIIREKEANCVFYVFSDDIKWCRENFKASENIVFVDYDNKNYIDLELMKNCKHNIIANSSFSWWGAWLNNNPDKIVIAPNPWFPTVDSSRQIPGSWIKVDLREQKLK